MYEKSYVSVNEELTSLNFTFNLNTLYLASILFTWLKFTYVNVLSQKGVIGNQPLVLVRETALLWGEKVTDIRRHSSTSFSENTVVLEVLSSSDREWS